MPRVLLIEDDPTVAKPTVRVIEKLGPCRVDWAPTPDEARSQCERARYDIFVSDFDLGPLERNGVELLGELRETHPDAVFVCISGSPREVPAWVLFVNKMDLAANFAAVVDRWCPPV